MIGNWLVYLQYEASFYTETVCNTIEKKVLLYENIIELKVCKDDKKKNIYILKYFGNKTMKWMGKQVYKRFVLP